MDLTLTMFAQTIPEAKSFLEFWIVIGFIASTGVSVVTLVVLLANRKQKREVNFAFEPASKEEFDRHLEENKREHENIFSKLGGMERGLRGEFSNELRGIRMEMNQTTTALASLRTSAEMLNQMLSQEKARLDRTIEGR